MKVLSDLIQHCALQVGAGITRMGRSRRTNMVQGRVSLDSHSSNTVPLGEFAREAGAFFESQVPATYRVGVSCSRTCARVDRYLPTYQSPVRRPWRKWGRPVCPAGQPTNSWPLRPPSNILSLQSVHFVTSLLSIL